jgi:hypothetical protein
MNEVIEVDADTATEQLAEKLLAVAGNREPAA